MNYKALGKFILIGIILMVFLINAWIDIGKADNDDTTTEQAYDSLGYQCEDVTFMDSVELRYYNGRSWMEYLNQTGFCSDYSVSYQEVDDAYYGRNNIYVASWTDEPDYWRQVYGQLYLDNKDHLQALQDSLLRIKEDQQLDRDGFARMVVAFVQDIPYEYVLSEGCTGQETAPCNGEVTLGLYSPVEFVGAMHGDCDTRTVLLYTLLRNFGYQPLILNSSQYLHSILALDVASAGEDFDYKGKRYAYWETTNVGWLAGMLPPDMNNKDYWSVSLDYEY